MGNRRPVTRVDVRKAQRKRKAETKKLTKKLGAKFTEFGRPANRPSLWKAGDVQRIATQIRDHLVGQFDYNDDEISDFYGISTRSLYRYKIRYPEIARAMIRGEEQLAKLVERKLVQSAVGYRKRGIKIMQHDGSPMAVHFEEEVQPNVAAQVAFLKAKKPEYKDRLEHSGDPKSPVRFIIDGLDVTHDEKGEQDGRPAA